MGMDMAQQPVALAGHDRGQRFPAFERENVFVDGFVTLRPTPSIEKSASILLQTSADDDFRLSHQLSPMFGVALLCEHPLENPRSAVPAR
jgi:hypothetical protein